MSKSISAYPVKLAIAVAAVAAGVGLVTTAQAAGLASGTHIATTTHYVAMADNNPWP
jgi:hypothetical protein